MENEILVRYEKDDNWKKLNANPIDSKNAISTLYAIAPFERARVKIGWLPPMYYKYENGRVKRLNIW